MQIHEITRKPSNKEPVNEILGAVAGGIASVAGGIAKQAGKQFVQKFAPQLAPGDRAGSPTDRVGGMKVSQSIVDALVPQLQKAWAQAVQAFLANSKDSAGNPATSLKDVTTPSIDSLKNDLVQMINRMISPSSGSFSYQSLSRAVGDDPVAKQAAQEITTAISTNIEAIYRATVDGAGTNAVNSAFVELVKDGIAPAQNTLAYDRGSQSEVDVRVKRGSMPPEIEIDLGNGAYVPFDKTNPKHVEAAKMLGVEIKV
jgi:histone H3/H4